MCHVTCSHVVCAASHAQAWLAGLPVPPPPARLCAKRDKRPVYRHGHSRKHTVKMIYRRVNADNLANNSVYGKHRIIPCGYYDHEGL